MKPAQPILQRPDALTIGHAEPLPTRAPDLVARQSTLRALDQIAGRIDAAADRLERDGDRPAMARMLRDDAVRLRGEITNAVRGMR